MAFFARWLIAGVDPVPPQLPRSHDLSRTGVNKTVNPPVLLVWQSEFEFYWLDKNNRNLNMTGYFPGNFLLSLSDVPNNSSINSSELPKISIVMPSYNQARFIERSILSVLNQGYPNLELVVIDGGSTDGTVDIIRKYNDYIDFWVSETDNGQSDALNKGFARCTGDIYGWLNSDDLYLPRAFWHAADAFRRAPNKKIVFGDWLAIDESDNVLDLNHAFDFSLGHFKYEGFHLNAQSMFWRAQVHNEFSGFDIALYNTMDYQMIMEFGIKQGQRSFHRIPQVLGAFRRYEGQKTLGFNPRVTNEHKRIANRYEYNDKYGPAGKLKRFVFRFRRAWWYFKRGGFPVLRVRVENWLFHASRT